MEIIDMDDCFYKAQIGDSKSITKFFEYNWLLKEKSQEKTKKKIDISVSFKRPDKDHASTLLNYQNHFKKCQKLEANNKHGCSMRSNFMYTKHHSSLKKYINDLKPIFLNEMQVNHIHYGSYLECKTIAEPYYIAGMHLLVEDKHGQIENLSLYDFNFKSYQIDPKELIPLGTRLFIKEPYLKQFTNTETTDFGIQVESPTDLILAEEKQNEIIAELSIEQLIKDGNSHFQKQNFNLSVISYTWAILKSNKKDIKALLNRSQAYIKLERHYLAFKDAQLASQLDLNNEKAYFRMGRSQYSMQKYEKAKIYFEKCLLLNKDNKDAKLELDKTNQRLIEAQTGNYDFETLLEQYLQKECLYFDVADFKSSKISVVDIPNKSKGVIANQDIKKGELLVVSKAVSASFKQKTVKNFLVKTNLIRKRITNNDQCENYSNIVYKMQSDPDIAKEVYSLYGGDGYDRNEEKTEECLIDVARIGAIQRFNSFTIKNAFEFETFGSDNFQVDSGLWTFPSMFNHDCISDTIILFIGDLMILYAKHDIKKNDEITNKYFPGSYASRCESAASYNFKCNCRLCLLDEHDLNLEKRQQLLNEIKNKNFEFLSLNEAKKDVKRMRKLYLNRSEYQFDLLVPLQILADKYRENANQAVDQVNSNELFQKSALAFEEIYKINESSAFNAIYALKEAYDDYKYLKIKDKQKWCYDTAANYFSNNKIFFEKFWNRNELGSGIA